MKILILGSLAIVTLGVGWYVVAVFIHFCSIFSAAGRDAPRHGLLSRLAPSAAAEAEAFWAAYPRKAGERVQVFFRKSRFFGIVFAAAFLALPLLVLAVVWQQVLTVLG